MRVKAMVTCILLAMLVMMGMVGCSSKSNNLSIRTYSISGTVSGAVSQGVTLTLSTGGVGAGGAGMTTTTASGTYSFVNLKNGTYTITPSLSGYIFSPSDSLQTVNGANVTNIDFTTTTALLCTQSDNVFTGTASIQSWNTTKAAQVPVNELPGEFNAPYQQPLANLAWEDGVYITRDGLTLYAFYNPMDELQALISGATPDLFYQYERGNLIGQDFTNPLGQPYPWLHADVAMSQRRSVSDPFCSWILSNLHGKYYNLGAPDGILNNSNSALFDYFVYTDDSGGQGTKIMMMKNVGRSLSSSSYGTLLPSNIDEPGINEDNPDIERFDNTNPQNLVLFYESDNKPGGSGGHDLWYSTSNDGGATWGNPLSVTTINTSGDEMQPHLYYDGSEWWLYYTATNPSDGKLAIYRALQGQADNWNDWKSKQLVVSAGTAAGVGEPTLTSSGDLSFVVVTHNITGGTAFDQYDCDPWFMKKK